jgi:phospholipid/cholesterol/gamma-HCH transport system permease protein
MINWIERLGADALDVVWRLGNAATFLFSTLARSLEVLARPRLLIQQIYSVGVMTLLIILVSGLFVGMVLGLQFYTNLVDFGAESSLGLLVALTLVRELGPVLTGLLFAGRAGSALTAEIGLMKATEQLAAMEMMAVDPISRVIAPRYLAGIISVPLLAALFTAVGVLGGHFIGVTVLGVDAGVLW